MLSNSSCPSHMLDLSYFLVFVVGATVNVIIMGIAITNKISYLRVF